MNNQKVAKIFYDMARLLDVRGTTAKGVAYRRFNYLKAAKALENLPEDISLVYRSGGLAGLRKRLGVGEKMAKKIEEYLKKNKIKDYEELKKETAIQQIIAHYFQTKGISLDKLKENARKKKIIYSRFTKPAKQLLELAGSLGKAKEAVSKVAEWANSRGLDYAIETVFKKWLELDRLKPKEVVKKPYYRNNPMWWSEARKRWYVINEQGEFLEFAGKEKDIEWRITK